MFHRRHPGHDMATYLRVVINGNQSCYSVKGATQRKTDVKRYNYRELMSVQPNIGVSNQ